MRAEATDLLSTPRMAKTSLPWLVGGLNLASLGLQALLMPHGWPGEPVVAVFPPWWSPGQVFQAAGSTGAILGTGLFGWEVIVRSPTPDLPARLSAAGALLTVPAARFSGCTSVGSVSQQ